MAVREHPAEGAARGGGGGGGAVRCVRETLVHEIPWRLRSFERRVHGSKSYRDDHRAAFENGTQVPLALLASFVVVVLSVWVLLLVL